MNLVLAFRWKSSNPVSGPVALEDTKGAVELVLGCEGRRLQQFHPHGPSTPSPAFVVPASTFEFKCRCKFMFRFKFRSMFEIRLKLRLTFRLKIWVQVQELRGI